jgi:hypothetical protein
MAAFSYALKEHAKYVLFKKGLEGEMMFRKALRSLLPGNDYAAFYNVPLEKR